MTGRARGRGRAEGGQAIVEFVIVLPLLLALFIGIISAGLYLNAYLTVAQAARVGVRSASLGVPVGSPGDTGSATIYGQVDDQIRLGAGMSPANATVCLGQTTPPGAPPVVTLTIAYTYTPALAVPFLPDPTDICQSYTMVQEASANYPASAPGCGACG